MKAKINSTIPAATLAQRLAALSETQLMDLAATLAQQPDADAACTAVLETLERRVPGPSFDRFVAEIYGQEIGA